MTGDAGITYPINDVIYIALYEIVFNTTFTQSLSQLTKVADHETGHAVDQILGWSSQSGSANFSTATLSDLLFLDYTVVGVDDAHSTRRNPCNTSGYRGPLVGLVDPTSTAGQMFCSGGSLVNPTMWGGKRIDQILNNSMVWGQLVNFPSEVHGTKTCPGGWSEWYAQAFRDIATSDTGSSGAAPTIDGVVLNDWFQCTAGNGSTNDGVDPAVHGWLYQVHTGTSIPVLPSSCTTPIPGWFSSFF